MALTLLSCASAPTSSSAQDPASSSGSALAAAPRAEAPLAGSLAAPQSAPAAPVAPVAAAPVAQAPVAAAPAPAPAAPQSAPTPVAPLAAAPTPAPKASATSVPVPAAPTPVPVAPAPLASSSQPPAGRTAAAGAQAPKAPQAPAPNPRPSPSQAAEPAANKVAAALGQLVYTEGQVELRRGSTILSGEAAEIGAPVLAFDLLVTGARSKAEVELGAGQAGGGQIKVAERTAFYFDSKELDDASRSTTIRLLAGSLALKVEKLGGGSFNVSTGGAVLGVRGTTFSVDSAADGSLLVSCVEGRVAVRGPEGPELSARPGSAVEASAGGGLAPRLLPAERLSTYRAAWVLDREAALLRSGAPLAATLSAALGRGRPAFESAMAALRGHEATLGAWEANLAAGREYRFSEELAEKKALGAALFACLKALPAFETPYYRLAELAGRRADGLLLGGGLPPSSPSLEALFAAFESSRQGSDRALGELRRALSLFARVAGDSPLGEFFGERSSLPEGGAGFLDFDF